MQKQTDDLVFKQAMRFVVGGMMLVLIGYIWALATGEQMRLGPVILAVLGIIIVTVGGVVWGHNKTRRP